ncbi:MAG: hypothetical protein AAFY60_17505, partial [Myxococcota bacterium]
QLVSQIAKHMPAVAQSEVRVSSARGTLNDGGDAAELQPRLFTIANDAERLGDWMHDLITEVGEHAKNHHDSDVRRALAAGTVTRRAFFEVIHRRASAMGFGRFQFAFDYIDPNRFQSWLAAGSLVVDPFYSGEIDVGVDAKESNGSRGPYSWPLQFLYLASIDRRAPELLSAIGRDITVPVGSSQRQPDSGVLKTGGQIAQDRIYLSRPGAHYSLLNADIMGLMLHALLPGLTAPFPRNLGSTV